MERINVSERIREHCKRHPDMQVRDLFKFIYQSAFGCEHMISSPETVTEYIRSEYQSCVKGCSEIVEPLAGEYSRVNLDVLGCGMSAETLGKLFYLSARQEVEGEDKLRKMLAAAEDLIKRKEIPFAYDQFAEETEKWRGNGYPPVHHSDAFRGAYHPAYRVISNRFIPYIELFSRIDGQLKRGNVKLAIEGSSASGKSTLGSLLQEVYGCTLFHMDDFFLRPEQRTAERFAEPGGNVDRERFLEEVLLPLSKGEAVQYRVFNCGTFALELPEEIVPAQLTVIEGAYSMHPDLAVYYDLSVFLDVDSETQRKRIGKRNTPELAKRFFGEWIPMERRYFEAFDVKERCDIVISVNE